MSGLPADMPLPPPLGKVSPWHPHALARLSLLILGVLMAAALVHLYGATLSEGVGLFSPGCFFRKLTGLKCPGCGGTRAMQALLRGDIAEALRFNLFWLPSVFMLAQELVRRLCCTESFRTTRYFRFIYLPSLQLYAATAVFWFIARNIFTWSIL